MRLLPLLLTFASSLAACGHASPKAATTPPAKAGHPTAPAPAATVISFDAKAALDKGREANNAQDFATAAHELELAIAVFERDLAPGDETLEDALGELSYAYQGLQRWSDAEQLAMQRLEVARRSGDRYREATALESLASCIKRSGDLQRALPLIKQALAIDAELDVEETDAGHLDRLHSLANAYDDLGEHTRAARMLENVLAHERRRDPSSARTATVMHNLALAYRDAGELEDARSMFEGSLSLRIVLDGPTGASLVSPLNGLAGTFKLMGEYDNAVLTFKRVLALAGKDSTIRAIALADLGDTEVELGQLDEGIAHLDQALAAMRKAYPSGHPEIVRTLVKHTEAMLAAERVDDANRDTDDAMRMATALDAGAANRAPATASWLADVWQDAGHPKRARELRTLADVKQPKTTAKRAAKRKK